jgi:hypothetical protein
MSRASTSLRTAFSSHHFTYPKCGGRGKPKLPTGQPGRPPACVLGGVGQGGSLLVPAPADFRRRATSALRATGSPNRFGPALPGAGLARAGGAKIQDFERGRGGRFPPYQCRRPSWTRPERRAKAELRPEVSWAEQQLPELKMEEQGEGRAGGPFAGPRRGAAGACYVPANRGRRAHQWGVPAWKAAARNETHSKRTAIARVRLKTKGVVLVRFVPGRAGRRPGRGPSAAAVWHRARSSRTSGRRDKAG